MSTDQNDTDSRPTERADSATPDPRRWIALAVFATATLMVVLDISVINLALPTPKPISE